MAVTTRNVRSSSPADAFDGSWDGEANTRSSSARPGERPGQGGGRGGRNGGGGPSGERPAKRRSFIWRWRRAFFLLALLGLACVAAGGAVLARTELPQIDELDQSSFICAADLAEGEACTPENAMAKISTEDRVNVNYEDLSPSIINAVVAMEDRDFFEHDGVAPLAIARALYRDLRGDAVQQGGSTITQQYVKNAFLSPERALTRKIKEAILSIKLEQRMSKEDILEGYLNTIYFGRGAYGIQAASRVYFNMDAGDLGISESAYLAGLIRAPALADASEHPEEAARRRRTALVAMEEEGYISEEEMEYADAQPFELPWFQPKQERTEVQVTKGGTIGGDYVTAYVQELLQQPPYSFSEDDIYGGGLRVYTSIDLEMQAWAWQAVEGVLGLDTDPAASMVAVDDQGLIRAMVGGPDFNASQNNYAVRGLGSNGRPVGSTFKPIALAEAVRQGFSLESRYDAPAEKTIDQTTLGPEYECLPEWTPHNYAESEQGQLDLMEATAQSSNTAYAQLMIDLGPTRVLELAEEMGMPPTNSNCPTTVLGTGNASPLDMATVFSTFANQGVRRNPSIITKVEQVVEEGGVNTLHQWTPSAGHRVLTEQQANLVTHSLEGVIDHGTGTRANIGRPAAGKTGTTSDNKDAWFVGYVPRLTAAVWMGYPDANWQDPEDDTEDLVIPPMNSRGFLVHDTAVTGGSLPAQIWHDFMLSVTENRQMSDPFPEVSEEQISAGRRLEELRGEQPGDDSATTETTMPPFPPGNPGGPGGPGGPGVTRPGNGNTTTTSTSTSSTTSTSTPDTTEPSPTTSATTTTLDAPDITVRPGRP